MKHSSNVAGDSNDENNFLHKLLLTNTQVSKIRANGSSVNTKLSKIQLHEIGQSGGSLGRLLGPLSKTGLRLMKNVVKPLTKIVLITLVLTAVVSATDAAIHKKMFGSGNTTLIISVEKMDDIMKIIKSLEDSSFFIKSVSETIKNEAKELKGGLLRMLLGTLGASLLGNLLTRKGTVISGEDTIRAGKGTIRAGQDI